MKDIFEVAGGSVPGRDHARVGRNNHDAFLWHQDPDFTIVLVADGCGGAGDGVPTNVRIRRGAGPHSEVGAKIGLRLVLNAIIAHMRTSAAQQVTVGDQTPFPCWERVRQDVLAHIRVVAGGMGSSLSQIVNDYFLFTIVGALITRWGTSVFSIGDGVYALDDEVRTIGPFPNNEPPYIAYGLVPSSLAEQHPHLLQFHVHELRRTEAVNSLLVGTDGVKDLITVAERNMPGKTAIVGPLHQFWNDPRYFRNSDMVRRQLSLCGSDHRQVRDGILEVAPGLLPDDTTLIVVRRAVLV